MVETMDIRLIQALLASIAANTDEGTAQIAWVVIAIMLSLDVVYEAIKGMRGDKL